MIDESIIWMIIGIASMLASIGLIAIFSKPTAPLYTKENEPYKMTEPQLVQLDCRISECRFNRTGGCIKSGGPAIVLQEKFDGSRSFSCYTEDIPTKPERNEPRSLSRSELKELYPNKFTDNESSLNEALRKKERDQNKVFESSARDARIKAKSEGIKRWLRMKEICIGNNNEIDQVEYENLLLAFATKKGFNHADAKGIHTYESFTQNRFGEFIKFALERKNN